MAGKKTGKRLLTWVLVLVMALSLLPLNALAANGPETDSSSGMNFDKRLVDDKPGSDGNYTIQMTAQATGTTTTKVEPMDIVLVLDQSGSMADDFNGKTTYKDEARRQYAMKAAVNSFIGEVAAKYSDDADHRMAIVTFDDNAKTLAGWTAVNSDGADALTSEISDLPKEPEGATNVGEGMQMAKNLMNDAYTGNNTDRQKTVIVFTDGVPTTASDFSTTVANAAIAAAKDMKDNGVTIYTVGIFNDAKPEQLYGDSGFNKNSNGTVGSNWSDFSVWSIGDIRNYDVPAGNRFLNYLSSNFERATNIGLKVYSATFLGIGYHGWEITQNFNRDSSDYYKTATDASDLANIFEKIATTVPAPVNDKLDEKTVITDTLSNYFTFAGTEEDVKVYAIDANGNEKESEDAAKATATPNGKTVTVTGYDFSKHYQGIGGDDEETLVIEIKVKPDTSYTNWGASGEYETNEGIATVTLPNIEKPIAEAASPKVHVDTYQVTYGFDNTAPDEATPPEDNQYYISGQTADVKPPEPSSIELDGHTYTFNGWKNGEADVDEKIDISGNVTLTGSWSKTPNTASYTVNYLWNGEQIQAPTTGDNAMHGDKITITDTSIDGYTLIPGQQTSMTIGTGENVLNLNYYKNVTLTANSDTVTYDSKEHTVTGYTSAPEGVTFESVSASGSGTDANTYNVTFGNNPVGTYNNLYYVAAANPGTLTINKRSVTLTSASASKVYDGTPLTKPEVTVGGDGFVDGEGATYNVTGTITNVGETKNTFTYTLDEGTKATNYTITKTEGTLKITKAPTYTFDLNDPDTIKVNKEFKSMYGRSAEKSFTATATIEKQETYIIVNPGIDNNVTNNGSAVPTKPDYTKVGEATGTVTLKAGKTEAFDFGKNSTFQLEQGDYRITVKETKGSDRYYVTYDDTTYTYDFTVNNEGKINIDTPITCTFTNVYTKRHTAATPSKPTLNTGDHYAYVMGYPDGTVRPNGSITRAEVSTILFRLLSDKTRDEYFTTESSFTDVKAGAWYNNSIATLEKAGVIVDTAKGGAFRPNEAITRAELAAMLAQFSDAKPVKGVKFSDVSSEHWAYEAIAIAAKMGWIEGYPDGTFRPDATITRAEMMTLVNRALERVPSDEDHLLSKRVMLTFPDCKSGDWFYIAVQEATNSHTYERAATEKNGDEQWTALRANRDWTQLEK